MRIAALFFVCSCWRPETPAPPPIVASDAAIDAAIDAPPVAIVLVDAPYHRRVDAADLGDVWKPPLDAPRRIVAPVVSVEQSAERNVVYVARGTRDGVARSWIVTVAGEPCIVIRVDQQSLICISNLSEKQLRDQDATLTSP